MIEITEGKYYMWRGHGVLALNPSQWCNKGFEVTLCRYVGENMKFYAPSSELRPIADQKHAPPTVGTPLAEEIRRLRNKKGWTYQEIAHTLNVGGSRTASGAQWNAEKVRIFIAPRESIKKPALEAQEA
jgi:hypothetical protein